MAPDATATSTATPDPFAGPTETPFPPPGGVDNPVFPTETATEAPVEGASPPLAAPPTGVPGFLPTPTLVNPNDLTQGRPALTQPGAAPLVGPAVPLPEATAPSAAPPVPGAAQLIDNAVVALSYLWLCCGFLFILALALIIVWLARRSRRR